MAKVKLNKRSYETVTEIVRTTQDARVLRRAQALLWLSDGERVEVIAQRLRVTRQAVYLWCQRFADRGHLPIAERLADGARGGRPDELIRRIEAHLEQVTTEAPSAYGYAASVWTAALLREHLRRVHQIETSQRSVSRALEHLQLRWKRPRHTLARRSPTWRQAKGGSSADSKIASARSS